MFNKQISLFTKKKNIFLSTLHINYYMRYIYWEAPTMGSFCLFCLHCCISVVLHRIPFMSLINVMVLIICELRFT